MDAQKQHTPASAATPEIHAGVHQRLTSGAAVYVLFLLGLINAFSYVDRTALALVLPQLKAELTLSDTTLGLVSGLPFALCFALCSIPAAWIADNWSRRYLITIGLSFWSAMTALSAIVTNGFQLAAARFMLGAGEATGIPSSASMIADLFDLKWRSIAFSVMGASPYIGLLVGFPIIGWVTHEFGWRAAFLAAGLPGIAVALLFFATVKEPARKTSSGAAASPDPSTFRESLKFLFGAPSYSLIIAAGVLSAMNQASMFAWGPAFLDRVHGLNAAEIGKYFGSMRGVAGLAGALSAGVIVSYIASANENWRILAPGIFAILIFFADALFLFAPGMISWQAGMALGAFFTAATVTATYPLYIGVAKSKMRATATAVYLLIVSLIGLTFGPLLVGVLNDQLFSGFGDAAIRYSMLAASFATVLSGGLILAASLYWRRDVARAFDG